MIGHYSWCDVAAFHDEVYRLTTKKSDLRFIGISKYIEIGSGAPGVCIDVHGVGCNEKGEFNCPLDLIATNKLADVPVRLDASCPIREGGVPQGLKVIGEIAARFSLLEVLSEIFFEISFYGSPESRDAFFAGLVEVNKAIESGEAKLVYLGSYDFVRRNT